MQAQMAKAQVELEHKTINASAAGGKVKVAANGAGENSRDQDWANRFWIQTTSNFWKTRCLRRS